MGNDDSVEIAATTPRDRARGEAVGTMGEIVVSGRSRADRAEQEIGVATDREIFRLAKP